MVEWMTRLWRSIWPLGLRPRSAAAFCFAVACVAIATAVRIGLGLISPDSAVYAPYYSATLVAALAGGPEAGISAAALGGLAGYLLFVPPEWSASPFVLPHVLSFGLYGASSAVIIWVSESYRALLRRLQAEQTMRQLLNRELAHRIKNTWATVQGVVGQTLRDHKDVLETLNIRIAALAATHDLLLQSDWHGGFLREILAGEFAPYGLSRVRMKGEDVLCPPALAVFLALAAHELTTNAVKYGALSRPEGHVDLSWSKFENRLDLRWVEIGGPKPMRSMREGFGTRLLKSGAVQFQGSVRSQFEPSGLVCEISLVIPKRPTLVTAGSEDRGMQSSPAVSARELGTRTVDQDR